MKHPNILQYYEISFSLFCFMVTVSSQQNCPAPDVPVHGKYLPAQNKFSAGDQVIYSCKDGFKLLSKSKRLCQSDGTWSDETPFCDRPAKLKNPLLGGVRVSMTSISRIIDDNSNTCFMWEKSTDHPLAVYLDENMIVHAIRVHLDKGASKFQILAGMNNNMKVCADFDRYIETSQWALIPCRSDALLANVIKFQSVADRPINITICEIQAYVKNEYDCDRAPKEIIANGYFQVSRNTANLICEEGYRSKNGRLVCERNSWRSRGPRCEELLCDAFVYNTSLTSKGEWILEDIVNKLSVGTRRKLKCNPGYKLIGGPERVTCLKNGTWTRTNATCIEESKMTTRTIIIAVVAVVVVVIILVLLGITIILIKKQRNREVVVVYRSTDGSMAPGSESEYATPYYESIEPSVPTTPRPSELPQILSDNYILPEDSIKAAKRKAMPADIAFGTLKQSTLYGN